MIYTYALNNEFISDLDNKCTIKEALKINKFIRESFMNKENIYVYEDEEWEKESKGNSMVRKVLMRDLLDYYHVSENSAEDKMNQYEEGTTEWNEAKKNWDYIKGQRIQIGNFNPCKNIYEVLRSNMKNDDNILFDTDPKQHDWIHYKNGKLNLYTKMVFF